MSNCSTEKVSEFGMRSVMKGVTIIFDVAKIKNLFGSWIDFGVDECNGIHPILSIISVRTNS